jgi:uncharacterized hydantoinase/oxoprolinase family protein
MDSQESAAAEQYIQEVAQTIEDCDNTLGYLRFSTSNPEVVVLCHILEKVLEITADNFATSCRLVNAINNQSCVIDDITEYLSEDY